eukprot:s6491_g2.t1
MDGWMDGWMDGRTAGRMDGWMDGCTEAWMHGGMDGGMDGGREGWMDGWMDVYMYTQVAYLCDFMPLQVYCKASQAPRYVGCVPRLAGASRLLGQIACVTTCFSVSGHLGLNSGVLQPLSL